MRRYIKQAAVLAALLVMLCVLPMTASAATTLKITQQPQNQAVPAGEDIRVELMAEGDGLKYVWYQKKPDETAFRLLYHGWRGFTFVMKDELSGSQIYCVVSDQYGNSVQSDTITIYAGTTLKLTKDLKAEYYTHIGDKLTLSFEVEGDGLTYKWYYRKPTMSSTFQNAYHGYREYSFNMLESYDGQQYYCVITDKYGVTATTATTTIYAVTPTEIIMQPYDVLAYDGSYFYTTFLCDGDEPAAYEWYVKLRDSSFEKYENGVEKNGVKPDGDVLHVTMNEALDGAQAYCVLTDKAGETVTTDTIAMTMLEELRITYQPRDEEAYGNESISVWVTADGEEEITCDWYIKIPGSNSFEPAASVLEDAWFVDKRVYLTMCPELDGAEIYCVLKDAYSSKVVSRTARLTMLKAPDISDLPTLKLPAMLKAIEEYAFAYCDARVIVVPESCTRIEEFAFFDNYDLEWLVIEGKTITMDKYLLEDLEEARIICPMDSEARVWAEANGVQWTYRESAGEE